MYRPLSIVILLFFTISSVPAQSMDNKGLEKVIISMTDSIAGSPGQWRFKVGDMWMMCVTDANHNRMRIITPIIDIDEMNDGELEKCMEANFHSALDVKYCISDGVLWSAFIHPMKELSPKQVEDAIKQVYTASATFGTIYTSTDLVFPAKRQPAIQKGDSKS